MATGKRKDAEKNRATSYKLHISPLVTPQQQACMLRGGAGFDLKSYDDVRRLAKLIYGRLADKTMPMDESGPWPDEWIALFKRWMDEGCQP